MSAEAARAMAREVRRLLRADVAVAVTGAGGPASQDGCSPGTVFLAVDDGVDTLVLRRDLEGKPVEVCRRSAEVALGMLADRLRTTTPTNVSGGG